METVSIAIAAMKLAAAKLSGMMDRVSSIVYW
jgi:hypothetical protein